MRFRATTTFTNGSQTEPLELTTDELFDFIDTELYGDEEDGHLRPGASLLIEVIR